MATLSPETRAAVDYFLAACPPAPEAAEGAPCGARSRLYEGAIEDGALLATDFYTLRDWLGACGYAGEEALHALLILMMLALNEGSLCLEISQANLEKRFGAFVSDEDARHWAAAIASKLSPGAFPHLIGNDADAARPLVRQSIQGRDVLFFQRCLRDEQRLMGELLPRLAEGSSLPAGASLEGVAAIVDNVLTQVPLRAGGGAAIRLDDDQQTALGLALLRRLVVISGGPGTGKTSLVLTILRSLARCGVAAERMALAAPTGRAAQRLGDALRAGIATLQPLPEVDAALREVQPTTLHQLLGYSATSGEFRRHAENPVPADVVVVDETSMVGLNLMAQLFHALAPQTRLVLLGDKDQLPSVDAGAVLAHLLSHGFTPSLATDTAQCLRRILGKAPAGKAWRVETPDLFNREPLRDAVALLRTNHRSQQDIQRAAQAINSEDVELVARLPTLLPAELCVRVEVWQEKAETGGCFFLPAPARTRELRALLDSWARHAYAMATSERGAYPDLARACRLRAGDDYDDETRSLLGDLFRLVERARLLTLVRDGPWGCDDINRFLQERLAAVMGHGRRGSLIRGTPILITRNDPMRRLSNGDIGIALAATEGGIRVVFPRREGFASFPAEALESRDLGFALTVHKSQGSEYDQVLLVFPPEGARGLLRRELVYTAVTRARRLAVLCGKEEVIRRAIASRTEREAGWLRTLHRD